MFTDVALSCAPPLIVKAVELVESIMTPQLTCTVAPPLAENAPELDGSRTYRQLPPVLAAPPPAH